MNNIAGDVAVTASWLKGLSGTTFSRFGPKTNSSFNGPVLNGTALLQIGDAKYPLNPVGEKDPELFQVAAKLHELAIESGGHLPSVDVSIINPLTRAAYIFKNISIHVEHPVTS